MKKNKYDFVVYTFIVSLVIITTFVGRAVLMINRNNLSKVNSDYYESTVTVIIDAGHGGEDSGAVGINGVLEKDLNLMLSNEIKSILNAQNIHVIMTRTDDKLLYKEEENIKGQRKLYDLKNRYLIASKIENAIFVSIHMNKFPIEKYRGLQVYYSPNNLHSHELAQMIQSDIKAYLQNYNEREIKNSSDNIYILSRLNCPAILIECGFLSNAIDADNLTNKEYRKKMALILSNSIIENIY